MRGIEPRPDRCNDGAAGVATAGEYLGHATAAAPAVTHRSYVGRGTVRNAAVKRGLAALRDRRDTGSAETAETERGNARSPWHRSHCNDLLMRELAAKVGSLIARGLTSRKPAAITYTGS